MNSTAKPTKSDIAPTSQFQLLRQRRFLPFFVTQFTGAANDNWFKFAFTVWVTYQVQLAWLPTSMAGIVIGGLFILPFLLLSATSGQLADKYAKNQLMQAIKLMEIIIMLLAAAGWWLQSPIVLLTCVFLMGVHSSLFGPAKFAWLPQTLQPHELTGANGLVKMGTFAAILLGNTAGGLTIARPHGEYWVAVSCLVLAVLGWLASRAMPTVPAVDDRVRINWNPLTETWRNLKLAWQDPLIFKALISISWMWFFGAVYLGQFPHLAKEVLHGNAAVASLLLVLFSVGIGAGALSCERLSKQGINLRLVPAGALGMAVFSVDLYFALQSLTSLAEGGVGLLGVAEFVSAPAHWRVMLDLLGLSLSTGLYSVPLYALIQWKSPSTHRARIVAANNILNALFMVASALIAGSLLGAGWTDAQLFLALGGVTGAFSLGLMMLTRPDNDRI